MAKPGLTLDTGALIALERRDKRMMTVLTLAEQEDLSITIPAAVLAEWFRGNPSRISSILEAGTIECLDARLARLAGEALVGLPEEISLVDAMVMASAAQRGDHVYTSDIPDLQSLQSVFRNVRLFKT